MSSLSTYGKEKRDSHVQVYPPLFSLPFGPWPSQLELCALWLWILSWLSALSALSARSDVKHTLLRGTWYTGGRIHTALAVLVFYNEEEGTAMAELFQGGLSIYSKDGSDGVQSLWWWIFNTCAWGAFTFCVHMYYPMFILMNKNTKYQLA